MRVVKPSPIYILTPSNNRENYILTPKVSNKIVRSTTPTIYHIPKAYISKTPQSNTQNYMSLMEQDRHSFLAEKSTISTEPIYNKSFTNFTNKSLINQRDCVILEEEKCRMEKDIKDLQKENNDLRQKFIKLETKSLLEKQKYEEKIMQISSELNKRLINEKNQKRQTKGTEVQMLEKLLEDMKNENVFAIETLKKDNKKTTEMYEMLIREMENNINELLKKNGMLNLNLKEFERKNRELQQINKHLNKKNIQLEVERLG